MTGNAEIHGKRKNLRLLNCVIFRIFQKLLQDSVKKLQQTARFCGSTNSNLIRYKQHENVLNLYLNHAANWTGKSVHIAPEIEYLRPKFNFLWVPSASRSSLLWRSTLTPPVYCSCIRHCRCIVGSWSLEVIQPWIAARIRRLCRTFLWYFVQLFLKREIPAVTDDV